MISRLKVMAELDITQTHVPQDGRFSISHNGFEVDVRVATLPSAHGETMVLRILDNAVGIIALPALGFRPAELQRYEPAFRVPQGAIIVSGPTGSGKSSTLYSTLAEINSPERSIVSVEDPVEYQLEGLKQVQINPPAGLTFPVALRSILRNDPDVIFVGEIRDGETAQIAAEASITGHLVFSTIHTTSAAAVPLRLTDMGVDPYLVASALTCVVSQRLARRLCAQCAIVDLAPDLTRLRALGCTDELLHGHQIRKAVGCDACHGTGYHGRFAIYEVLLIHDAIRTAIYAGAPTAEIQRLAVQDGMDTLRVAALRRLVEGDLSVDELARVVA
jgi:type IV pilus assembly protein PilB